MLFLNYVRDTAPLRGGICVSLFESDWPCLWQKLFYATFEAELLKVVQLLPGPLLGHMPLAPSHRAVRKPDSHEERLRVGVLASVLLEGPADSQHQPPDVRSE